MKSVGKKKNLDKMEKLMKMMRMRMKTKMKKRKKAGKVKRGREKQMMEKMIHKTPVTCKKKNCSVLVGLLTWILVAVFFFF